MKNQNFIQNHLMEQQNNLPIILLKFTEILIKYLPLTEYYLTTKAQEEGKLL